MRFFLHILLICSTLFYTRGAFSSPFLQSHLITAVFVSLLALGSLLNRKVVDATTFSLILIFVLSFFHILVQFFVLGYSINLVTEIGRCSLPILILASFNYVVRTLRDPIAFSKAFVSLGSLVFVCDMILRLSTSSQITSRYALKHGGFLFVDSNFTGIFVVGLFFLLLVLREHFRRSAFLTWQLVLFVILLSTGSLASYFMFALVYALRRAHSVQKYLQILILIEVVAATLLYIFVADFFKDGSLLTKVQIIQSSMSFLEQADRFQLFFGGGSGLFIDITNQRFPSHNLFGLFVEGGVLFAVTQLLLLRTIGADSPSAASLVVGLVLVGLIALYPLAYIASFWSVIILMNLATETIGRASRRMNSHGIVRTTSGY